MIYFISVEVYKYCKRLYYRQKARKQQLYSVDTVDSVEPSFGDQQLPNNKEYHRREPWSAAKEMSEREDGNLKIHSQPIRRFEITR